MPTSEALTKSNKEGLKLITSIIIFSILAII